MYCKHCKEELEDDVEIHECPKKGLLNVSEDDSFLVSALIGGISGSGIVGGILGGDIIGGLIGDALFGDD